MKEGTRQLLEKAERAIQAADALLASVGAEFAAGRAYYAMFYTAEALLHERDLTFSKHGALHAALKAQLAICRVTRQSGAGAPPAAPR